ncbi:lysylphosphatidylglycerol synthetase-like protein (DUF2156 family) [Microbacterium sp. 1154]|uniref:hypothetical protein n=1 Tax=Microbacterium sp. 1154 TaxID=2817733 RepID=UPI0028650B65|nr:hypothetical protein [Microbacterium sp. 1154]MDR6689759.1 lysylphosphatidylglycerol synthetase-like protein (DUF2156 family) [Microbacterium sp. 1154]
MSSRAGRAQRVGRGMAAAAVATFVATLSHSAVSAERPSLGNIVLALCLAAPVCVLLAGRAMSWTRLSLAVVLSQALFHALLVLDLSGEFVPAGHHSATSLFSAAGGHSASAHASESPWMWAAHAVAALVTIVALGRGERAVQAIARFFVAVLSALRPFQGLPPRTDAVPSAPEPLLLTTAMTVLSSMRHRGPPLAA